jgi:hypothetical protein
MRCLRLLWLLDERHCRSLGFAPPDFLLNLVAPAHIMRLSLKERRTREFVRCRVAGNPGRDDKRGERFSVNICYWVPRGFNGSRNG